ncbi:ammonia-dependent NAD(+) synthetase [Lactobacillus sp. CC-MHH1034]|uniref:ammonia-dependent NAD(+) synthetase n=1 Tax=Agrilactobacillus fermenti TaxID=2586909 RepID=UPI001E49E551|nr:ammonia-dependent NAD(+) synthetase [Agrilactobacillus fermenti]MCD2255115.1 ammonia-dependent NAD(+) synthetase [Agrilactobacillus fermenti]
MRPLQKEIIAVEHTQPTIDPQKEIRRSIDFLKAYLKKTGLKTYVLGISGGQDSTLAGTLTQMAIKELRAETGVADYRFIAVRLPYGAQADEQDAMDAIAFMQADEVMRVNIKASVDAMVTALDENPELTVGDFNKGNIKARVRMVAQYGIAGQRQGVVVGTDHAAENITGFYTKFGDGAADVTPLYRLNKRQGKQLLEVLGAPRHLYLKTPTADLEEDRPALPDEVALGVTYDQIDDYLEGRTIDEKAAEKLEQIYLRTQHKRHLPITVFDDFWK